jgi:hypothetical protein
MKLRFLVPVLAVVLVAGGCSSGDKSTDSSAKKGDGEKLVEISPLTGLPMPNGRPDNPVFVVKVENTVNGEPQHGLRKADMVIEELVEGGLTRLAAFFYSDLPTNVAHVRSLRTTDIGISAPVAGQIVASGGAPKAARKLKRAGVKIFGMSSPGFHRDARPAPYNVVLNLKRLSSTAKVTPIPGPYVTWTPPGKSGSSTPTPEPTSSSGSATPTPEPPKKTSKATVRFSNGTKTTWRYAGGHWKRVNTHAGPGQDFVPDTLIVMFCRISDAGYRDPAGNPVPETSVEGSGRAVILRDGEAVEATWKKPATDDPISFESQDGQPLTIDPGKVWLELAPKGAGRVDY